MRVYNFLVCGKLETLDMLLKRIVAACFALIVTLPIYSAEYEYGSADEFRGVTKIYIDTGDAVDLRNIMASVLKKRLPKIEVVASESSAQLVLVFSHQQIGLKAFVGELLAVKPGTPLRLLAKYRHDEEELDDLADEIAKKFVKEYVRINR